MAEASQGWAAEDLSFENALVITQALLDQAVAGTIALADLQRGITQLVATENGARGFFVVYLSDGRSQMDAYTDWVVAALQTAPEVISTLLVKNLAMATAMILTHGRNQKAELVSGSEQVQRRSLKLIQRLRTPQLQAQAVALAHSLTTATGEYQAFLERWQYDTEQKRAIAIAVQQTGLV